MPKHFSPPPLLIAGLLWLAVVLAVNLLLLGVADRFLAGPI